MWFRVLADIVVVVHFSFVVFIVVGGLLAWRWRRLLWLHIPAVLWGAALVTAGLTCPLTPLERHLRARAGSEMEGGFVETYIEGVLYPGGFTTYARAGVIALIAIGWVGLLRRRLARDRSGRLLSLR